MLRAYPDVDVIRQCSDGLEALRAIQNLAPELVFLDVQMPECDGFEVLERLGAGHRPAIVFVTAYDAYALRAFEAGALDYLLKPFEEARFGKMMSRVAERVAGMPTSLGGSNKIAIRESGQVTFVDIGRIDWIESADYYACLHVGAGTHLLRRSLADLEKDLRPAGFARIHRAIIVNLERVERLFPGPEGDYEVVLRGGDRLRMSRRYRRDVLELLACCGKAK